MYCMNCGKETNNENQICNDCSPKKKSNKGISIVGIVLSFIIPLAGFILSIIGLTKGNKIEKETGEKNKYFVVNVIGIIASVFMFIIQFVVIIVVFALMIGLSSSSIEGKWECRSSMYSSSIPVAEMELGSDKTFKWGKYNDSFDNKIEGEYRITSTNSNNNYKSHGVTIEVENYVVNGEDKEIDNKELRAYMYLYKSNKDSMRFYLYTTQKTYYCTRVN